MFKPHWALKDRRVVFLDLDTVIVGNMDFLLEYDGPFCILRDFYYPTTYGSAVMAFAPGCDDIWNWFERSTINVMYGDQDWLLQCVDPAKADRWQDLYPGKIVSYKVHCQESVPEGAAVICFHGPRLTSGLFTVHGAHWHDRSPSPVGRSRSRGSSRFSLWSLAWCCWMMTRATSASHCRRTGRR
jgi:hypothetical protein